MASESPFTRESANRSDPVVGSTSTLLCGAGIDASAAGAFAIGATNATTITIGRSGQSVSFPGTVTIGSLSTTVDIADRVIHLGVTTGNVAVPTLPIGISADRGASAGTKRDMSSLVWDETVSKWKLCLITAGDDATLGAYQALNCGLVTSDAGIVSTGGPVTLTANAASSLTTSAGTLTLTGAIASVWSTVSGLLSISGAGGISLQGSSTPALVVNSGGTAVTVQAGATLAATGTGNINLPNNGSARFQIEGVAVGAGVTAAALDTAVSATAVGKIQTRTVTIGHADLTDLDGEQSINIGAVLPANAMILAVDVALATSFTGGGAGQVLLDIGTSGDPDAIVANCDLFAAAVDGAASMMPAGIAPFKLFVSAGAQLLATVAADVNVDLLTAGAATITVSFVAIA